MAVRPEQLPTLLERSLSPIYVIAGAEPLLVQECRDQVLKAAHSQGFLERDVYVTDRSFDWSQPTQDSAALSLFSARKIMDIRLPTGKPGRDGSKFLTDWAGAPDPDVLLVLSCGQWDAASRKSKWAASLARPGVLVEIWPVKPHELPAWIRERMKRAGLMPEPDAVALLAELVEGNLLAAQQEIEKLVLLGKSKKVTAADVTRAVANSSRFDSFRLVECALKGALGECLRVSSGLHRTNVPIQAVTGALYRELTMADSARSALRAGEDEFSVFRRLHIWQSRQGPMKQAIRRLSARDFGDSFCALALIDRQSKGRADGDPWQTLDRLLWSLCEPAAPR